MTFVRGLVFALVSFFLLAFFYLRAPYLYDSDSYLHLAVARLYAQEGLVKALPWPRFSVMGEAYGDKELLFHIALLPFVHGDAATGGRVALAAFGAGVLTTVGWIASRYAGSWGWALPWWLLLAAAPWNNRITRLRPELLALILLLLCAELMVRRRWRWLGVAVAAFTVSYTAFHVAVGLVAIWVVVLRLAEKRWEWMPLIAAATGAVIGLLVHPHPTDHFRIWYLQNVTFFQMKNALDVGPEIFPPGWDILVLVLGAWWVAIGVLLLRGARAAWPSRPFVIYASAAFVFLALFLSMGRMVLYFVPFAALAAVVAAREATWPRGWRVASAGIAIGAVAVGAFFSMRIDFIAATVGNRHAAAEADLESLGARIPPGARVAATWEDAQLLAFWAPHGRYLNLYDPLFMAVHEPEAYQAQRAFFAGRAADPAAVVRTVLDSDYVAIHQVRRHRRLLQQLARDRRFRPVYGGDSALFELRP